MLQCFPLDNTGYEADALGGVVCDPHARRTLRRRQLCRDGFRDRMSSLCTPVTAGFCAISVGEPLYGRKNRKLLRWTPQTGRCHASTLSSFVWTRTTTPRRHSCARGRFPMPPTFTAPVRDTHADEIYVASILVQPGAVKLLQADITDLRMDENVCGVMRDGITGIPTAQLQEQAQQLIEQLHGTSGRQGPDGPYAQSVYDADNDG